MKLLLDTCVSGFAKPELEASGHDVVWAADWDSDPGDETILCRAHQEQRVLVTLDKDFGELAVIRRQPHHGIIRLVDVSALRQGALCIRCAVRYARELASSAIVTVSHDRVRIRLEPNSC